MRYRDASQKQEGCIRVELFEQAGRPGHFALFETWRDQMSFDRRGVEVPRALTDALEHWRRQTRRYTVIFDVASGVPNLKRGSDVRVGGLRMGEVSTIEPCLAPDAGRLMEIAVRFNLDHKAQLFRNAQIFVSAPLIGSEGWLDIPSVGDVAAGKLRSRPRPVHGR